MKVLSEKDIEAVLDERVRPLLRAHNGDVELAGIEEGRTVRLRLLGACAACMGAEQTVNDVIVASLREACPAAGEIVVETGVSRELIDEALRFLKRVRR
jgi:Fe-S cluster biogenesis protein NfuA